MYKTTFAELKTRAKDVLKSNYWYSFGVCILVSLITSLGTSVATVTNMVNSDAGSAGTSISAVLQILITLFVTFPLSVGSCRFFIKATVNAPLRIDYKALCPCFQTSTPIQSYLQHSFL